MSNMHAEPNVPVGMNAFGEWISEVFKLWAAQWSVWVLQGLIFIGIIGSLTVIYELLIFGSVGFSVLTTRHQTISPAPLLVFPIMIIFYAAIMVASSIMMCGMVSTALKQLRGEQISVGNLFDAARYGWGAFVCGLVIGLGMLACCIGVYATFGLFFLAIPLMIDRKMPTIESLQLSWRTVSKNFWLYVLFALVMSLLSSAGTIACYVGIIATMPFMYIAQAVAYFRTFEQQGTIAPPFVNGTMPPPYLPPTQPVPPSASQPAQPVPSVQQNEVSSGEQNTKTCQHCGSIIPNNFTICPNCNQPV